MRTPIFRKVASCTYEYAGTGYLVEQMANGKWDAYLPSAHEYRLWSSPGHRTRDLAGSAISWERRKIAKKVREAIGGEK